MEEAKTDLGTVRIHNNVIAAITSIAVSEVDGVAGIHKGFKDSIYNMFGKKDSGSIKIEIDKNNEINLDVSITVKYGVNIPEIARKVQESIRQSIEKSTDLSLKEINVNVQEIEREVK
ncbi:MAG: Asp23/Gls24 family envelope stress response protein [Candidatus Omnitrophica bacterium]|nr:Asp23/Gls24 family envelope stress response protein [Candidatus Omnitrophota bacterium]